MGSIHGALLDPLMVTLSITVAKGRAAIDRAKAWDSEYQQVILGKKIGKKHPHPSRSELCLWWWELQCGVSLSSCPCPWMLMGHTLFLWQWGIGGLRALPAEPLEAKYFVVGTTGRAGHCPCGSWLHPRMLELPGSPSSGSQRSPGAHTALFVYQGYTAFLILAQHRVIALRHW